MYLRRFVLVWHSLIFSTDISCIFAMTSSFAKIGSFASEIGAEITAYDSDRQLLYVVSGGTTIQIIDVRRG